MALAFRERTIDDFKGKLVGGGVRPNLFEVELAWPDGYGLVQDGVDRDSRFLVKAASLPASQIQSIEVPFRGRILKIAGDRKFETWTITVINDQNFSIRQSMESWMNNINNHEYDSGVVDPNSYQTNFKVHQLGRGPKSGDGNIPMLRSYEMRGCFPTGIGAIDLSYDNQDQIQEYQVEFQVQWWQPVSTSGESLLTTKGTARYTTNQVAT